jgi:hypothetical protein
MDYKAIMNAEVDTPRLSGEVAKPVNCYPPSDNTVIKELAEALEKYIDGEDWDFRGCLKKAEDALTKHAERIKEARDGNER